jgi:hypothetical protein
MNQPQAQLQAQPAQADKVPDVVDARSYLDAIKNRFIDQWDVYDHFLVIMKDFRIQALVFSFFGSTLVVAHIILPFNSNMTNKSQNRHVWRN